MGAINNFDCLLTYYSTKLLSQKWFHAIFYFLIDIAVMSGLHLWLLANPDEAEVLDKRIWIGRLIEEIHLGQVQTQAVDPMGSRNPSLCSS